MINDKKEFYKKIVESSLKDVNIQKNVKRTKANTYNHRIRSNKYKSNNKNSIIKMQKIKTKFFTQCIISILILTIFYYLIDSDSKIAKNIVNKAKFIIENKISKNNMTIDENIIKKMQEEIENSQKK